MKFWLKMLQLAFITWLLIVLTAFVVGMIRLDWWFLWGHPESRLFMAYASFMIFCIGGILIGFLNRLTVPNALAQADRLLEQGRKDEAMELYVALLKNLFGLPRIYRSRIPQMMDLTFNWLIENGRNETALILANRVESMKVRVSDELQLSITQLRKKPGIESTDSKRCTHCGSVFYEPKTMNDKIDFTAVQKVRVGCSKCGTPVCFGCSATAADKLGESGNCYCPKCNAELGRAGEAGELGKHFAGWDENGSKEKPLRPAKRVESMKVSSSHDRQPHFTQLPKKAENENKDKVLKMMSAASDEKKVEIAIELLKNPNPTIRTTVISEIARSRIRAVGVLFELANRLSDEHKEVRLKAAEAFWQLKYVDYAIRSLRDEYEISAHISKEEALRGISVLMDTANNETGFEKLLNENWEVCPLLSTPKHSKTCTHCDSAFYEPKTMKDKADFTAMQKVRVGCSKCGTPVCFGCAATAADKLGESGNCYCPKCNAELGRAGEAGEPGKHFAGWD